jgi:hypothetical protein
MCRNMHICADLITPGSRNGFECGRIIYGVLDQNKCDTNISGKI